MTSYEPLEGITNLAAHSAHPDQQKGQTTKKNGTPCFAIFYSAALFRVFGYFFSV